MEPSDLTIQVLREIRDEIRLTKEDLRNEIRQTNGRLDQTNERLDKLDQRQVHSEIRLSTELVAVSKAVDSLRQLLAA